MIEEIHHKLNDLAVKTGRSLQSKETRMLHWNYGKREQEIDQTIPFYENLLFALALCRTKTVDGVQEAKALLEKLLAYQGASGLFPVYLHEFPFEHDLYIGAHLLPPLYYLDHYFHQVLGNGLKEAIRKLAQATRKVVGEMPFPLKAKAIGALIALNEEKKESFPQGEPFWSPKEIGSWLLGLSLAKLPFPQKLDWNSTLHSFTGPWRGIQFEKGMLELTLYELFLMSFQGSLPQHLSDLHPSFLQGALLFPETRESLTLGNDSYAAVSFDVKEGGYERGDYPFYIAWGNKGHSLVLHPGTLQHVKENKGELEIDLGLKPPFEDREKAREIVLSISQKAQPKVFVNGFPATTFKLGDKIVIETEDALIELIFEQRGKGIFLGHLSRGNRPTEWVNAGKNRFNGYDTQLALRSIDRDENVKIILRYRFSLKSDPSISLL